MGDGNLSNPNGRATRLRITCDARYPKIATEITANLKVLFPQNKISVVPGPIASYFNISVYSNKLNELIPWRVGDGPKEKQKARVPQWVFTNAEYVRKCLKGLIQTDGSIYTDRGYTMINFTNHTKVLADDVYCLFLFLGYHPNQSRTPISKNGYKFVVRLSRSREVTSFLKELRLAKK